MVNSVQGATFRLVLPALLGLAWALLLLVGLPHVVSRSLPLILLMAPDLGLLLVVSAGLAIGWALLRAAVVVRA